MSTLIPSEVIEYIIASGFHQLKTSPMVGHIAFMTMNKTILLAHNSIYVHHWFEGDNDRSSEWRQVSHHETSFLLPFLKWTILLDVMGAVDLKENFSKTIDNPVKVAI